MRENKDQKNSEHINFLGRDTEAKATEVRANISPKRNIVVST